MFRYLTIIMPLAEAPWGDISATKNTPHKTLTESSAKTLSIVPEILYTKKRRTGIKAVRPTILSDDFLVSMATYKTSQVAAMIGIHPNTVRLYEELGRIPKLERLPNG